MCHQPGGMRTPDWGSTTGAASWTDREPASGLPRRGERSESIPPSPPYFKKSSYASTGFFFRMCHPPGGDENPRPGFDNWRSQLDRPRARERAAPQGRAKRVNPPLTAIFEMRACTQVRALFFYILRWGDAPREKRIPKLILLHSLILFAEVIHQRSNGGQQPAPGGKYRMDHFPPRLPLIQYHL
ncbi:Uncharacterised protein [Klebsiella quasipneumoniae]|nr:Uncharacterised protein [Klebsiella quasipneumoniae]VGF47305.1 Uncharacterised protein [Klebsiella quasipneumoniae]VGP22835.1 hypothetical protein SB02110_03093 [Klebsiella quasipneumoniae subsp. quasipneumoniae]